MKILFDIGVTGTFILIVITILSIVSWTIIVYKLKQFRNIRKSGEEFLRKYRTQPLDRISKFSGSTTGHSLERIFQAGISGKKEMGLDGDTLEKYLEGIMSEEIIKIESLLIFLATTASISPLIGLFGTVVGIMNAFLGMVKFQSANIVAVAPGVAEALITTVFGLAAAIPAAAFYNYFISRVRIFSNELNSFKIDLLIRIRKES